MDSALRYAYLIDLGCLLLVTCVSLALIGSLVRNRDGGVDGRAAMDDCTIEDSRGLC
jgi:hypothetical protein